MRREYLEIVKKQQLKNKTCEEKIIQERKILNKRFQHTVTTQHNGAHGVDEGKKPERI